MMIRCTPSDLGNLNIPLNTVGARLDKTTRPLSRSLRLRSLYWPLFTSQKGFIISGHSSCALSIFNFPSYLMDNSDGRKLIIKGLPATLSRGSEAWFWFSNKNRSTAPDIYISGSLSHQRLPSRDYILGGSPSPTFSSIAMNFDAPTRCALESTLYYLK